MTLAHRLLGIRSCNEVIDGRRDRPCLEYDIGRCLAPCVADVCTLDRYGRAVEQARLLIEGRQDELLEDLRQEMGAASAGEQFERAAHLRDAIRTLETVRDRRNALETPALGDRDAFGLHRGASGAVVTVFQMRRGRVVDRLEFGVAGPEAGQDPGAEDSADGRARSLVRAAILECYADRQAPAEVHLPVPLEEDDHAAIEAWLSVSRTVRIVVPRRGDKRGLLNLAARNATLAYQARFAGTGLGAFDALDGLRALLALSALPRRIECIDISTLQGRDTVGALVVAVDGRLRPADYRKFRVRGPATPPTPEADFLVADDVGAVREVVARRYQRVLEAGGPFPDLIVIDGGKGQLGAAYLGLRDVGLDRLVAIGLAKKEELIFTRDRDDGLALPRDAAPLRLLQQLRDEAHRFALTFHRTRRAARQLRSGLDEIHGIGPRRRAALLTTFGSLAGVRRASRQDLETVVGARAADAVIRHFEGRATSG
jgi:excinuclease ABC subunit C